MLESVDSAKMYALFNTSKTQVDSDVQSIIEWVKTQPHLPEVMDEVRVLKFFIVNKCSIEKTKQKIDCYYTIRSSYSDWFSNVNPNLPTMKEARKDSLWAVFPKPLDGLHRIWMCRFTSPNTVNVMAVATHFLNILEVRLQEDFLIGDIFIFDCEKLSMEDFGKLTPTFLAKCAEIYQRLYSFRLKAAYYVNSPSIISVLLTVLKSILKAKIFNRIHVANDAAVLKTLISDDQLPSDYGGKGPSLKEYNDIIDAKLKDYNKRFDTLETLRCNEELRPEKLQNDERLGFHGNFKKLNVD